MDVMDDRTGSQPLSPSKQHVKKNPVVTTHADKVPSDGIEDSGKPSTDIGEDVARLKKLHQLELAKRICWWAGLIIQLPALLDLMGIDGTIVYAYFPFKISVTDPNQLVYAHELYPRVLCAELLGVLLWIAAGIIRIYLSDHYSIRYHRKPIISIIILVVTVINLMLSGAVIAFIIFFETI